MKRFRQVGEMSKILWTENFTRDATTTSTSWRISSNLADKVPNLAGTLGVFLELRRMHLNLHESTEIGMHHFGIFDASEGKTRMIR